MAIRTKPMKERSYELMQLKVGHNVLDLGCGPGIDTIPLGQIVGPTGHIIGIDIDKEMIDLANKRSKDVNMNWVEHKHFDAESIPYNSDYFDSCHCERLLQHLLHPERSISEMIRVVKSNGWIVVADSDHTTLTIDTPDIDIEWKLRRFHTEMFKNGYIGRQLYRLFKQQNLSDIRIEIFPLFSTDYKLMRYITLLDKTENDALANGIITEEELNRWSYNLENANKNDTFFSSISIILIAGRKIN